MRVIRVILQIVISLVGGLALAILLYGQAFGAAIVLAGLIVLLLALTFYLKEQNENRLLPNRQINYKPMGIVLLVLGIFEIYFGVGYFVGAETLPDGTGRCRAICGLSLLISQIFGEVLGRLVVGFLWSMFGLFSCYFGYKIMKHNEPVK